MIFNQALFTLFNVSDTNIVFKSEETVRILEKSQETRESTLSMQRITDIDLALRKKAKNIEMIQPPTH